MIKDEFVRLTLTVILESPAYLLGYTNVKFKT